MRTKIGDICTLKSGTSLKDDVLNDREGIPYVKVSDMNLDGNEKYIVRSNSYANETISSKMLFPEGTILFPKRGGAIGTNKKRIASRMVCADLNTMGVIPSEKIRPLFLYYYFQNIDFGTLYNGSSVPQINNIDIAPMEIELPSLDEQDNAIAVLEKVDCVIRKREEEIKELDELIKARFVELFGTTGKQVPLTDYVWFQEGPGVRSVDFTDEGTILLTGSNINDNTISFGYKSDRHISNELASGKYAHFMCDKDDILVVSSAIDPDKFDKKVVVVDVDKKYCLNTGIIRFKPNKQYLTLGYFREFLKTDYFKHQVSSEMRGIAQMHFGPSHLKQMTILLPDSIERQVEFETFVQQTDKSKFDCFIQPW